MGLTPIDTATGLQSGPDVHTGTVEVLVGWLVTHGDGTVARLGPDSGYADRYLRTHGGVAIEEMYVRRKVSRPSGAASAASEPHTAPLPSSSHRA